MSYKYLKDKNIKIVTHNFLVAEAYQNMTCKAELFYLDGKYIPEYNMSAEPVTIGNLSRFNFDAIICNEFEGMDNVELLNINLSSHINSILC